MKTWIRGVNLGGWLVLERFITPYLFAITSCHLEGNFCYYPGQAGGAINDELLCRDMKACEAVLQKNPVTGKQDYPWDEYSLMQAFDKSPLAGKEYLRKHYDTFVTRDHIAALRQAGVTHVRVPLPHWIQLNETEASPYVPDDAWLYFLRLVDWCRKYKIQVWADLHTAPGSQNGFDNSGRLSTVKTCSEWNENATLSALQSILVAMHNDDLQDVVTGIGVLNEPWKDCHNIREYNRKALQLVRQTLGNTTSVIIGDTFNATLWNDGYWENEPHTYLDSHYYHGTCVALLARFILVVVVVVVFHCFTVTHVSTMQSLPKIREHCLPNSTLPWCVARMLAIQTNVVMKVQLLAKSLQVVFLVW
jgi:glucan 1,3-beta-glucosidase